MSEEEKIEEELVAAMSTGEQAQCEAKKEVKKKLIEKLTLLRNDKELYAKLQSNCLNGAQNYDRSVLAGKMLEILEPLSADYAD